jgi:hypothetical protein
MALLPAAASAGQLADGTMVHVRLLNPISSETSTRGQPLAFVVTRDVIVDGEVVIARGTHASGMIVKARRADWGAFDEDRARLAFAFHHTIATNGQVISLRASPVRRPNDRITIDRSGRKYLQWASETDPFEAYVDGTYQW